MRKHSKFVAYQRKQFMDVILAILAAVYSARVIFFLTGFYREQRRQLKNGFEPLVSVVIPARNEERSIEKCVLSVLASDYPAAKLEIILVDDRSDDSTPTIMDQIAQRSASITVIHRTETDIDPNLRGKPGALQHGISLAKGEIVLLTDADCVVDAGWVRGMAMQFESANVGVVSALTSVRSSTFLEMVQDVEWTYTQAMACGGAGNNVTLGCFGNNMAIRRSVFEQLGGYANIPFSVTEDMALQQSVHAAGYDVRFAVSTNTRVQTNPCDTMLEYIKQRHRWVRGGQGLGIKATLFVLSSAVLWSGLVISALSSSWLWLSVFFALRFLAEGAFIGYAAVTIQRYSLIPYIIPSMAILWLTELFLPILVLKRKVEWKGQIFR